MAVLDAVDMQPCAMAYVVSEDMPADVLTRSKFVYHTLTIINVVRCDPLLLL